MRHRLEQIRKLMGILIEVTRLRLSREETYHIGIFADGTKCSSRWPWPAENVVRQYTVDMLN
jgi:hypothetical protein